MSSVKKAANAIGGKTARACDCCLRKRARWYCPADDAFLCQGCDTSVHSANRLACRHERTRLQSSSLKFNYDSGRDEENSTPAWHHGFTRKARTPRHAKPPVSKSHKLEENNLNLFPLVPEINGSEEAVSLDEEVQQLLCCVPVCDPFLAELYELSNHQLDDLEPDGRVESVTVRELDLLLNGDGQEESCDLDLQGLVPSETGLVPSVTELAKFAADVESLLGGGDDGSKGVDELGLVKAGKDDKMDVCFDSYRVKIEDEEVEAIIASHLDPALDMAKDTCLDWGGSCCERLVPIAMDEKLSATNTVAETMITESKAEIGRKIFLRLNYDDIISTWSINNSSPWTTGTRPAINPDDCLTNLMAADTSSSQGVHQQQFGGGIGVRMGIGNGEREARVSRYREKRRTRLFSKKIRYEVRKLNAEKRPRMKGRFVKRASSFHGGHTLQLLDEIIIN